MSDRAEVLVLFARHNETFAEEFVGVALTREQEKAMGQHVDTDTVTCWTERAVLQGWQGELNENRFPTSVYILFRSGAPQGGERKDVDDDPELIGAFVSRADAEERAEQLRAEYGRYVMDENSGTFDYHVWELEFGWLEEKFRHNGAPVPKY